MERRRVCPLIAPMLVLASGLLGIPQLLADVRISNIDNISFGSWSGSGDLQQSDGVCIYNDSGSNYDITATGSGTAGAFTLSNGAATVSYQVEFQGSVGGYNQLDPGAPETFSAADQSDVDCGNSTNANFRVTLSESNLRAAAAGSYSGSLTLMVEGA